MLWLDWGGDFVVAPSGGLIESNGWDTIRQIVSRAVLTNALVTLPSGVTVPPDYVYEPTFGAGLGLYVGQSMKQHQITALYSAITSQVMQLPQVDPIKPPVISFTKMVNNGILVQITVYLSTGTSGTVTLQVYNG